MGRIERRKRETWLQFLWALSDALATFAAFAASYALRFHSPLTDLMPVTRGVPPLAPYLVAGAVMSIAWLPLFAMRGSYRVDASLGPVRGALRLAEAALLAVIVGAALTFFYRGFSFSRAYFPVLYVCLVTLLLIGRALARVVSSSWRRRRPLRIALVGESPSGMALVAALRRVDPVGVTLCGRFSSPRDAHGAEPNVGEQRLRVIGSYGDVARVVLEQNLDVLILALTLDEQQYAEDVVTTCRALPVDIELVPDVFQLLTRRSRVRELDGLPVLSLREVPLTGWNAVKKRAFDLVVSLLALLVLSPLLCILAVLVKLSSPGPVFYAQERLGRDGRRFRILKLRSMHTGAESESGPVWATRDDGRRTRVGRWLREWSLDELPQLANVVRGEMSLVGPRPERPHFVTRFSEAMPDYPDRHRVKSGITGWAQVNGLRGDTSVEARTRYDLFYVENWSLLFDLKILALTLAEVLKRREAY